MNKCVSVTNKHIDIRVHNSLIKLRSEYPYSTKVTANGPRFEVIDYSIRVS